MTVFEFVLALLSIITSLALTHLVSAVVAFARASSVRLSVVHGLWMWTALATTIGNWGSNWPLRTLERWPAWAVLSGVALTIGQYAFCVLVSPEVHSGEALDLPAFHQAKRKRYITAFIVLNVVAACANILFAGPIHYADWLRDLLITLFSLGLATLALVVHARAVQLGAVTVLACLYTYFMVVACNITP